MMDLFLSKEEIQNLLGERKRILVTGGAGFIGSALIRRLLFSSKAIIFNLDKLNYASDLSSIKILSKQIINFDERYKFINLDICDYEKILEIMEFYKPDLIFHLAAESHVDNSINEPREFLKSNIIGTFNLLESVRILLKSYSPTKKNIFRFHHISTDEVFGEILDNSKFDENTRYDPRSPYSASKASSDHLVKAWFHTYGIPIIMTNCSNNYGPWQFPEKLIPLVVNNALNSKKIPIYGDGSNIRDWLYVEDHIDALLLSSNRGKLGERYCIGGNEAISNIKLVKIICSILDEINPQNYLYKDLINFVLDRPGHDKKYSVNTAKINLELGWENKINLKNGLKTTIEWYTKNQDWLRRKNKIN